MVAMIRNFPGGSTPGEMKCSINGREYEIYQVGSYFEQPTEGLWTWRTGKWFAFGFRKGGYFATPAEAQRDAMGQAAR